MDISESKSTQFISPFLRDSGTSPLFGGQIIDAFVIGQLKLFKTSSVNELFFKFKYPRGTGKGKISWINAPEKSHVFIEGQLNII